MTFRAEANPLPISADDLIRLGKPAQYLGGELNAVYKDPTEVKVRIALAFPDTYGVGMSHLGLQILYEVLNAESWVWAERAYMPLPDMEALLRAKSAALFSLESRAPLSAFDVVGFSLQYELCGTNILAMLDLGGIPLLAADRGDADPIVLGGGPFSYHPEAVAPFFDGFFLGDAERGALEIARVIGEYKRKLPRPALLAELRRIEGVYLPGDFAPRCLEDGRLSEVKPLSSERPTVARRLLPTLAGAPYASKPVVPNIRTIHNRLSIEVMRGCVRGCRFCQAGYLYRPQRERPPAEIVEMVRSALPQTGFEELSLLSLSTADYCSVVPLLTTLINEYGTDDAVSVSFPSTRVDALTPELLDQAKRVRRGGFTIAPEAGTQRLRDVINKGVSDEQILETARNIFERGWTTLKLYFMIGLPTETEEDLQGIVDIARRIKALPAARGNNITVSVSTMVPKPHTPFQWARQISPDEVRSKQQLLGSLLARAKINFRYHDAFSSLLEGVMARADRRVAGVIVRAYQLGCRLDAWDEHLDPALWSQAFAECGVDPHWYLRERSFDEVLPWDHLSCGIDKGYLLKEYRRALSDETTRNCLTESCSVCGACNYDDVRNVLWPREEAETELIARAEPTPLARPDPACRYRVRYQKSGALCFIGHLELVDIFHRAARRAGLPIAYSKGFHPLPRISFGPPLQLGVESSAEYLDLYLTDRLDPLELRQRFGAALPPGLSLEEIDELELYGASVQEQIVAHRFRAVWLRPPTGMLNAPGALELVGQTELRRDARKRGERAKCFILGDYISEAELSPESFSFSLRVDSKGGSPRATEVVEALSGLRIGDYAIRKTSTIFRASARAARSAGG